MVEWKIRAWDPEREAWYNCSSLNFDHERNLWRNVQRWANGGEDWLYDVEIRMGDKWCKLNGTTDQM